MQRKKSEVAVSGPSRAIEMAQLFASKSSHVIGIGKAAFYRQIEMELASAYDFAGRVMVDNMLAHDAQEGIGAFLEKRAASWEDR